MTGLVGQNVTHFRVWLSAYVLGGQFKGWTQRWLTLSEKWLTGVDAQSEILTQSR